MLQPVSFPRYSARLFPCYPKTYSTHSIPRGIKKALIPASSGKCIWCLFFKYKYWWFNDEARSGHMSWISLSPYITWQSQNSRKTLSSSWQIVLFYLSKKKKKTTYNDSLEGYEANNILFLWLIREENFICTNVNIHGQFGLKKGEAAALTEPLHLYVWIWLFPEYFPFLLSTLKWQSFIKRIYLVGHMKMC